MLELFALGIYSVQWLGVVLGVGAEVVLLCAHLIALHQRQPQWLESIPAVRAAQFIGLALIVLSGGGAVLFHILTGQEELLLLPVFSFKWALIIALVLAYILEKHVGKGKVVLEGFAGATWLALFLVHSIAPELDWAGLALLYGTWVILFGVVWSLFVLVMRHARVAAHATAPQPIEIKPAHREAPVPVVKVVPKPIVVAQPASMPVPPQPKPVVVAVVPVPAPKPVVLTSAVPTPPPKPIAAVAVAEKKPSFFARFFALFKRAHREPIIVVKEDLPKVKEKTAVPVTVVATHAAPVMPKVVPTPAPVPIMAAVSAPVTHPLVAAAAQPAPKVAPPPVKPVSPGTNLPVVEHLELEAPHQAPVAVPAPAYVPDWSHLPGLRIMPQRAEDLHLQNRPPVVQFA